VRRSPSPNCSAKPAVSPLVKRDASTGAIVVMTETATMPKGSWKKIDAYV
jgi:hypothetical protein